VLTVLLLYLPDFIQFSNFNNKLWVSADNSADNFGEGGLDLGKFFGVFAFADTTALKSTYAICLNTDKTFRKFSGLFGKYQHRIVWLHLQSGKVLTAFSN